MPRIKTSLFFLTFFIVFFLHSQSDLDYNAFLIPTELKTKANAVVRYEKMTVEILDYNQIKVNKQRIVTVFNKYGNRHVDAAEYYDDMREIEQMEARIYDEMGEEIKKVKEKDFTDASAVSEISIYEDDRVKYLNYMPLKYPYTVDYKSEVIYNNTVFFPIWAPLDDFYVSLQHAEYEIINTGNVELKTKKTNFDNYNIDSLSNHHFVASNVPAIKYEAYTPDLKSLVPIYKVAMKWFSMVGVDGENNNWKDFGKWMYDRLLAGTDAIPQTTIDEVRALTEGVDNPIERAKMVYKYMQDKTRYISIQVGIGGWKPMIANDVDKLGYADCKGLTNYTKALLKAVDVPSYYTVVYGGNAIRSIDKEFSYIEGNHVILCVPQEDENIFLECTSQTSPFGFTAGFTDDRDVLLVKPEGGEIVHTKVYEADDSVQKTEATVVLDETGSVSAAVRIATTGFQYNLHEGIENRTDRDQQLHYKEYWDNINNLKIDAITIDNDKEKVIYNENIELSSTNYASKSGTRLIFQPNMFNKVTNIPPRYTERQLEFKIDRSFKDIDEFIIEYPETLQIEAFTDSKSISSKFGTYEFKIEQLEGNKLKYTRTYILNKGDYQKEDYRAYRDFRKKIVKNDKIKVVLVVK